MSEPTTPTTNERNSCWLPIWNRKYTAATGSADLHVLDGYDRMTSEEWAQMTGYFISFLDVKPDSDVVELGCGSGAFLKQLPPCRSLSGCDYSASAVAHAAEVHRGGDFRIGEAARSPFPDASFDRVLSFGVTHYFDSLQYMTSVLEEMWRLARPGAVLFVGDIDDAAHQDEMEAFRNQHSAARQAQYVAGTAEIDHLYIPQSVFSDFAKSKNIKCQFIDQRGPELAFYYNSAYRYSVVLRKP